MKNVIRLTVFVAAVLSSAFANAEETHCSGATPFKYRVVMQYYGEYYSGRNSPQKTGTIVDTPCLSREVKSEDDYEWLHGRYEINPKVTKVVIVSATKLSD